MHRLQTVVAGRGQHQAQQPAVVVVDVVAVDNSLRRELPVVQPQPPAPAALPQQWL